MLVLNNPVDMHVHLRDGDVLRAVLPFTADNFSAALVMPNLLPPITSTILALKYKDEILRHSSNFTPIMSLYLNKSITKDELLEAKNNGISILKLYPKGSTTNSDSGVSSILDPELLDILKLAEDLRFILCIHAECGGFSLDREYEFGEVLVELASSFSKLKIVVEHMSDRRSIDLLDRYSNIYGTITLHHMILTLDDLVGGMLESDNFCKPVVKTKSDRDALLDIALRAHPKVSFGSDSAPHTVDAKSRGAAGIFSSPVLLPALATIFGRNKSLDNLQKFVSDNAFAIYGLSIDSSKRVELKEGAFEVDSLLPKIVDTSLGSIRVFSCFSFIGNVLDYSVSRVTK